MTLIHTYCLKTAGLFCALAALALTACSNDDSGDDRPAVRFDTSTPVRPGGGIAVLLLTGESGTAWQAEVVSGGGWCGFDPSYGRQSATGVIDSWQSREIPVYYAANATDEERQVQIRFTFAGFEPELLTLTQPGTGQKPSYPSQNVATWPELPAYAANDDFTYVTHYCPVYNQLTQRNFTGRNYTMCFDGTRRGSWWVAYPLHETYIGTGRDGDPWGFDPDISSELQADLGRGGYNRANGISYDRGHQVPNADRNANETMRYQTFYSTNATPQQSTLNQQPWQRLEGKVRSWVCSDTLYVVTGAWWGANPATTTDKSDRVCPVPDYYFKVVVRTVKGNIRTAGDLLGSYDASQLKSIGFWVKNASGQGEAKEWATSVKDIENKTGFTFFPTIPDRVKEQTETSSWGL